LEAKVLILKEIGFFNELSYGRKNGPSINDYFSDKNSDDEENIINYIKSGKVFIVSPGIVYDIFDKSKLIEGGPYILTDGEYVWFHELAYYIEQYHIKLPEEFIMHMKSNNWEVPQNVDLNILELPI
jgi:hypothetical protein